MLFRVGSLVFLLPILVLSIAGCNITIEDISKVQGEKVEVWTAQCGDLRLKLDKKGLVGAYYDSYRKITLDVSGDLINDNNVIYARFKYDGELTHYTGQALVEYEGVTDVNLAEPEKSRGYLVKTFGGRFRVIGSDSKDFHSITCETTPRMKKTAMDKLRRQWM